MKEVKGLFGFSMVIVPISFYNFARDDVFKTTI